MPYVVTQSCCSDASCVLACPVNCIHPAPGDPDFATAEMLYIDPDGCVDCGACATACPVDAIKPHTLLSPAEEPFRALNAEYFEVFPHADRTPVAVVPPQRRLRDRRPVRVAVVGAGPAGLYAADELLKHPELRVDVLDRLPTPHGLVRAGVAPDHQRTKQAERLLAQIEDQPGFGYLLGVEVGTDLSRAELDERYDAVIWTVGASADKPLRVPGEDLPGSLSATEVVGWYNGHPDHQDLAVDLGHERVVVVGNGNVALDVARVLTLDPERLRGTDIAGLPWAQLAQSRVREVVVLGRRGPAQAAFTLPELVGLVALAEDGLVDVVVEAGGADLPADTPVGRQLARLRDLTPDPSRRRIVLRFLTQPLAILGEDRVRGLEVERTTLEPGPDGTLRAVGTGETEVLDCGLVLRAVGYHGREVADLPYDPATGTVPSDAGRVEPGTYVAGWVKRGPTGFIGTNKSCAQETVSRLLDDLDAGLVSPPARDADDLGALLASRGVTALDLADWRALDAEERRRGAASGRVRAKIVDREEMLRVAVEARRERVTRSRYPSRPKARSTR
ncbi:FAD-dependent oxidoreductase [uncultured Nocardioides sp.]|uniref:FAD-dependent oxidoreductase n=1 Tax=uncultured Nocardioides sp. TaxID=198441 RepID=UPI00262B9C82|nr:FAD-dependent oxidoreductase [uncultured Nocardioides sp.]